jgi:hypothetical protein
MVRVLRILETKPTQAEPKGERLVVLFLLILWIILAGFGLCRGSAFFRPGGGDLTGKIFAGEQRHRIDLVTTDVSEPIGLLELADAARSNARIGVRRGL